MKSHKFAVATKRVFKTFLGNGETPVLRHNRTERQASASAVAAVSPLNPLHIVTPPLMLGNWEGVDFEASQCISMDPDATAWCGYSISGFKQQLIPRPSI